MCLSISRQFDRFRRKVIQNTFSGGFSRSTDQELEDEELLDYVKELAQERDALVKEIKEYAAGESKVRYTQRGRVGWLGEA